MGTARTMTTTTTAATTTAAKKECHERQTEFYVEAGTEFDKQYGNICETCYADRFFSVHSLCLSHPDILYSNALSNCCACINYLSCVPINLLVLVFLFFFSARGRLAKKKVFAINRGKVFNHGWKGKRRRENLLRRSYVHTSMARTVYNGMDCVFINYCVKVSTASRLLHTPFFYIHKSIWIV